MTHNRNYLTMLDDAHLIIYANERGDELAQVLALRLEIVGEDVNEQVTDAELAADAEIAKLNDRIYDLEKITDDQASDIEALTEELQTLRSKNVQD